MSILSPDGSALGSAGTWTIDDSPRTITAWIRPNLMEWNSRATRRPCSLRQATSFQYGGLEVSDAKRLKALEDENAKPKKLLAETMLDNAMLK